MTGSQTHIFDEAVIDIEMLLNTWYAVALGAEVGEKPYYLKLMDRELVLFRTTDRGLGALANSCIHRGAALALGKVAGNCLICPYHGWHFEKDGKCTRIPSNPIGFPIPPGAQTISYPAVEKEGWVWLFLGEPLLADPKKIPPLPHPQLTGFRSVWGTFKMQANYQRVIENGLDFAHAPFVHGGSFGNPDAPEVPPLTLERSDWGVIASADLAANPPRGLWFMKKVPPTIPTKVGFLLPNMTLLEIVLPLGKMILYVSHVPVSENTTISKWINFRNFFTGAWADKDAYKRTIKIFKQDQPIVESLAPQQEVHVRADVLQLEYRNYLTRLKNSLQ